MAVEYEISSDVATIKGVASNTQVANIVKFYTGSITYDDEPTSKYASVTINGKTQRVMLCVAVSGTVNYDDVPCLYSTVSGHRTLNVVEPTESGTPDDVPSLYETVVVDGKTVRALRCVLINATPNYDGVSSTCTFTDNGKTHTAQLVNQVSSGSIKTIVKGVAPLSLPDAIANSLSYVKAFGGTEQRNLPAGYTELQYIESTGTQYIDTGIVFDSGSLKFEADVYTTANLSAEEDFIGNFTRANTSVGFVGGFANITFLYSSPINVNVPRVITNSWQKYIGEFTSDNQMILTYDGTTVSDTRTKQHNSSPIVLFRGSASYKPAEHIRLGIVSIYLNNTMVRNFVPAKNSSGAIGMYDTVSGTFFTNKGTGDFVAGPDAVPTPDAPMDIVSNNGVVKYGYKSVNMFDKNTALAEGTMWGSSGVEIQNPNYYGSNIMPVIGGHTYTRTTGSGSDNIFKLKDGTTRLITSTSATITAPENAVNWRYNYQNSVDRNAVMVVEGTSLPDEYVPYGGYGLYVDGTAETITDSANHTATVATLLGVGDYRDTQNINTGAITRNVGVKVLDGTENWQKLGTGTAQDPTRFAVSDFIMFPNSDTIKCLSTHYPFSGVAPTGGGITPGTFNVGIYNNIHYIRFAPTDITTLEGWTNWLKAQYAAGTPVIVIYPLAEPTTESVTGQTLQVQAGDNTLEITQASLPNLELEAKYSKSA